MAYFFGLVMLGLAIAAGAYGIENIVVTNMLTVLNTTLMLGMICALGFSGILFVLGANTTNNKSSNSTYVDDDEI
ncbi:MAG: hypothetical protein J5714_03220 [Alphaproteobacteria bacterium]|nr:hypothetical protein [Alphaproteobacteria bacterium]